MAAALPHFVFPPHVTSTKGSMLVGTCYVDKSTGFLPPLSVAPTLAIISLNKPIRKFTFCLRMFGVTR
jgi:hypothetical protein